MSDHQGITERNVQNAALLRLGTSRLFLSVDEAAAVLGVHPVTISQGGL